MKLVLTNPPKESGIEPQIHACYVNGIYYEFRHMHEDQSKRWRNQIKSLKRSKKNHIDEIERLKVSDDKKEWSDQRIEKLKRVIQTNLSEIKRLNKLISTMGNYNAYLEHAKEMMSKGIIQDSWNGPKDGDQHELCKNVR